MEIAIAGSTLPCATLCHVVCTLVATGITGTNVTSSAVTQAPPHDEPAPLPAGYVAYPEVGFAYKVYETTGILTWFEARNHCIKDGAQLAMIDSVKKFDYIKSQQQSSNYAHVGIFRMHGDATWMSVSTGLPVTLLPWRPSSPSTAGDCVRMQFVDATGLYNVDCSSSGYSNYICEIPIPTKNTMSVN